MPVILAVEPDRKQAARLASIVRHQVGAELVLADTTERALDALGARVPDMVLVPALLSPQDDASLAAALRVIAAAAHVRTLTIPVLASTSQEESRGGFLSRWRKGRAETPALDGCDPAVFAEQITAYLREAAAERIELEDASEFDTPIASPAPVSTMTTQMLDRAGASSVESYADSFAAEGVADEPLQEDPFAAPMFAATFAEPAFAAPAFAEPAPMEAAFAAERLVEEPLVDEPVAEQPLVEELFSAHAVSRDSLAEAMLVEETTSDDTIGEDPSIDLSDELVALSVDAVDENLFAGEPFGTYTLPSVEEIEPEAAMFEVVAALDAPMWVEPPIAIEPLAASEPAATVDASTDEDTDFNFDRPVAWEPPVACEAPVLFESLAMFEPPAVSERPAAIEPPAVVASPAVVETPATIGVAAVAQAPVSERSVVREFAASTLLSSWHAWPPLEGVPIELPGIAAAAAAKPEVPDWSSLMASLREDMERRRGAERPAALKPKPRTKTAKPAVDEWGFFDPEQCGFSALLAKLDEITSA